MRIKNDSFNTVRVGNTMIAPGEDAEIGEPSGGVKNLIKAGAFSVVSEVAVKESFTVESVVKESLTTASNTLNESSETMINAAKVVADVTAQHDRNWLISELEERGIDYDGRMGVKKLRKILDGATR